MSMLSGKRVVVTGGAGFLGQYVYRELEAHSPASIFVPRRSKYDLRESVAVADLFHDAQPEIVIHLAAATGGVGANRDNPGRFFYDNAIMGLHLIEAARQNHVEKIVSTASICAYPKSAPIPFREDDLWNGYPEGTNAPYGLAKKMLLVHGQTYRQQYGLNAVTLFPVNLYGPGDSVDLRSSQVIPALIRKVVQAQATGAEVVEVWGTGTASREFLHVRDAAHGIILATLHFDKPDPVNLGSGEETSIKQLAEMICELVGYKGLIHWDTTKPDGQPRCYTDVSRAAAEFQFVAHTPLRDGLREAIEWYRRNESLAVSKPS